MAWVCCSNTFFSYFAFERYVFCFVLELMFDWNESPKKDTQKILKNLCVKNICVHLPALLSIIAYHHLLPSFCLAASSMIHTRIHKPDFPIRWHIHIPKNNEMKMMMMIKQHTSLLIAFFRFSACPRWTNSNLYLCLFLTKRERERTFALSSTIKNH